MFGKMFNPVPTYKPVQTKYLEKEPTKSCTDCGCIVVIEKLKQVKYFGRSGHTPDYYCNRCKPPYDEVWYCIGGEVMYFQNIPEHQVEVTEGGKENSRKEKEVTEPRLFCESCQHWLVHDQGYCPLFPAESPTHWLSGKPGVKWENCCCLIHTCSEAPKRDKDTAPTYKDF